MKKADVNKKPINILNKNWKVIAEINKFIDKFNVEYGMSNGYNTDWKASAYGVSIDRLPYITDNTTIGEIKKIEEKAAEILLPLIHKIQSSEIDIQIKSNHIEHGCFSQKLVIRIIYQH